MKNKYSIKSLLNEFTTNATSNARRLLSGDIQRIGGAPAQYIAVAFLNSIPDATVTSEPTSGHGADVKVVLKGSPTEFKVECKSGGATFDVPNTAVDVGTWLTTNEDALLLMAGNLEEYKFIIWNSALRTAVQAAGVDHHYVGSRQLARFRRWIDDNCTLKRGGRSSTATQQFDIPASLATSPSFANNLNGATITAPDEDTKVLAIQKTIQVDIFSPAQFARSRGIIDIMRSLSITPSGLDETKLRQTQEGMVGRRSTFPLVEVRVKQMSIPSLHKVFANASNFKKTGVTSSNRHTQATGQWENGESYAQGTVGDKTVYAKLSAFKSGTPSSNTPEKVFIRAMGSIAILDYINQYWSDIWSAYTTAKNDKTLTVLTTSSIRPGSSPPPPRRNVPPPAGEADSNDSQDDVLEKIGSAVKTLRGKREGTSDPKATTVVLAFLAVATGKEINSVRGYKIALNGQDQISLNSLRFKSNVAKLTAVINMTDEWKLYLRSKEITGAYSKYQTTMNPTREVKKELESSDLPAKITKAGLLELLLKKFDSIEAYNTKATEIFNANKDKFTKSSAPTLTDTGKPRPSCTKAAMKTLYVLLPTDAGSSESGDIWEPYASEEEANSALDTFKNAKNYQRGKIGKDWRSRGMTSKGGTSARSWDVADLWASPKAKVGDNFRKESKKLSFKELMFEMYSLNEVANMDLERAKDNLAAFILGDDEEIEDTIDNE